MTDQMDKSITLKALAALIEELTEGRVSAGQLGVDSRFVEDCGMDSLSMTALVFLCEECFGLDLSSVTMDPSELRTIGQALDMLSLVPSA